MDEQPERGSMLSNLFRATVWKINLTLKFTYFVSNKNNIQIANILIYVLLRTYPTFWDKNIHNHKLITIFASILLRYVIFLFRINRKTVLLTFRFVVVGVFSVLYGNPAVRRDFRSSNSACILLHNYHRSATSN